MQANCKNCFICCNRKERKYRRFKMKDVKAHVSKSLPIGATVIGADNGGAKIMRIISVKGFKARTRKLMCAGVSDQVKVTVISGKPDMVHKMADAVIVRQKKEFQRPDCTKVKFEDNAAIILNDPKLGMPKGTLIKGP